MATPEDANKICTVSEGTSEEKPQTLFEKLAILLVCVQSLPNYNFVKNVQCLDMSVFLYFQRKWNPCYYRVNFRKLKKKTNLSLLSPLIEYHRQQSATVAYAFTNTFITKIFRLSLKHSDCLSPLGPRQFCSIFNIVPWGRESSSSVRLQIAAGIWQCIEEHLSHSEEEAFLPITSKALGAPTALARIPFGSLLWSASHGLINFDES